MSPNLALIICVVLVFFAFLWENKRDVGNTKGVFWPTLWYLVVASRPVGVWFSLWGLPLPGGGGGDATDGSLIDRLFYGILTVIGLKILSQRRFDWGATFRRNPWLAALVAFMAVSILWSQYPYVSFKRYIKVLGSIVMALVVLTSERPFDGVRTVLRRCLYIHLPMSIICSKYFRDIGVAYDWDGTAQMWQGISTSKNVLGQIAVLGVLYFFWEVRRCWQQYKWRNLHLLYLLMAVYLLKGSPSSISMTSVSVCVYAMLIFLRLQAFRHRLPDLQRFTRMVFYLTVGLVSLVLVHSVVMFSESSPFGFLITKFGRNITLTDRTFIWHDVYAAASGNPLLGVGFGGFWIGRMANIPWNEYMTWELGQAHSGYIDTYLQIGLIGSFLLAGVLFSTPRRLLGAAEEDFDFTCFRITMLVTIMFIDVTETAFLRGDHHLWFIMQLCVWFVPTTAGAANQMPNGWNDEAEPVPEEHELDIKSLKQA